MQKKKKTAFEEKAQMNKQENTATQMPEEQNVVAIEAAEGLQQELSALQEKYASLNDTYLRLLAEFDNYRKRMAKERLEMIRTAGEELIQGLLPVLDDCSLAQQALAKAEDMDAAREGVDLILRKLYKYLESKGLQSIDAMGAALDTDLHEAVTQFPAPEASQKGKVIDVIQQGYTLNGKVIRYAKVVIGA
jgi:Molecular chaperone GrpE (heat shock protein)